MTAPAEREKARARELGELGECEYPGEDFVPCWCAVVTVNTPGGCNSAAEYLESVQQFGQPRFFVPIPP